MLPPLRAEEVTSQNRVVYMLKAVISADLKQIVTLKFFTYPAH